MEKKKYKIVEKYKGMTACTTPPAYERNGGGAFVLDDKLSQKDMGFLFEVIKYPGIEIE